MVDPDGDRAITVIGDRLQPRASDPCVVRAAELRCGVCHSGDPAAPESLLFSP